MVQRGPTRAARRVDLAVLNGLAVPLGVLDLLRAHPGLDAVERDQVGLAIARLDALAAEIRAAHAGTPQLTRSRGLRGVLAVPRA
jgi:hypothetical protein